MTTRKTSTSRSRTTSSKNSTGKRVQKSSGKSKVTVSSSKTQKSLDKNLKSLATQPKTSSKRKVSGSKTKDRGVKHTRCKDTDLFPVNSMPWRLEPRTGKFNLSWFMCFDHAVDMIERSNLKPRDYKLMCHTNVPLTDPLTGPVRVQRYVRHG